MRKRRIESPIVAIGKNVDESASIRQALGYLPIANFVNNEDCVVITANMVNNNPPEKAVVVGPQSLREIIKFFKERNPKRIVVAAGSGGTDTKTVLTNYGYDKVIEEEKVEFIDLNVGPFTNIVIGGKVVKETKINKLIDEATIIVSFTQLKIHEEATMSAALKNIALSWPPAQVHGYPKKNLGIHEDLHDFIVAMVKNIPIDLSIVSLNPAMVGTGPSKGAAKRSDMVIASFDPVACDTICARLLGFKPQAINYLYRCITDGVGEGNIQNIDVKGAKLIDIEKEFSQIAYGQSFAIDE
ncbi:Uncharacterized conserved protein, DUF362 family [Caloramator quimbayensis]|uniref:Uncharacterized conserved protein, DUF362 family n=1 Tax=Caloramator quimbayensis TaxID=1147123 RepID=A0A1T4YI89_9CLOT|nr:DUF362 domain-containing protein [Caloramator quimbayensis]SKB00945.1 Uncharacterized conserved protein, DUF362 family [Caloramator quimbayensis]